jgi:SAM domain (Sterile alpha motif)
MTGKGASIDIGAWLRGQGLGQYEATFRQNEIEVDILPELTEPDLEKLGVPLGHRKRLLKAIANLEATSSTPSLNTPVSDLNISEQLLSTLQQEKNRRQTENKLQYYKPYPKQAEFHAAGAKYRERLLIAGNQTGKTLDSAMELAFHATGQYPASWWKGHRFDRAVRAWACGETSEVVRETTQLLLLGPPGAY